MLNLSFLSFCYFPSDVDWKMRDPGEDGTVYSTGKKIIYFKTQRCKHTDKQIYLI